ncbi:MAG: hypothetical protein LVQ95_01250 [Candidatus Micrarchaeales archaeon]|nr:hypothetical protein [Candidatus Micrarchaeales archaeon]
MDEKLLKELAKDMLFFIEHPEATKDPILIALIELVRKKLESLELELESGAQLQSRG